MKSGELRAMGPCVLCNRKLGEQSMPKFHTIDARAHVLDMNACLRQQGLTQMLGGHERIAEAMGADEDLAVEMSRARVMICGQCLIDRIPEIEWAYQMQDENEG